VVVPWWEWVVAATAVYLIGVVGGMVWAGRAGYTYTTGNARLTCNANGPGG
jgi:hypothetical protein